MMDLSQESLPATGADPGYGEAEVARYAMLQRDPELSAWRDSLGDDLRDLGFERFVACWSNR